MQARLVDKPRDPGGDASPMRRDGALNQPVAFMGHLGNKPLKRFAADAQFIEAFSGCRDLSVGINERGKIAGFFKPLDNAQVNIAGIRSLVGHGKKQGLLSAWQSQRIDLHSDRAADKVGRKAHSQSSVSNGVWKARRCRYLPLGGAAEP